MALEHLTKIRAYLVKLRREVAANTVADVDGDFRSAARNNINSLISLQKDIETLDRAIEDEKASGSS